MVTLSLVLPCYNRFTLVRNAIKSIARCDAPPEDIVLVDDGSTDGDLLDVVIEFRDQLPGLRCHRLERSNKYLNSSRPYNVGIQLATGEVVVYCAAELLHFPGNFTLLRDSFIDDDAFVVGGSVYFEPEQARLSQSVLDKPELIESMDFDRYHDHYYGKPDRILFLPSRSGVHALRREHLLRMRGFEKSLTSWGHNDGEMYRRATELLGLPCVNEPRITTIHQWHSRPPQDNMATAEAHRIAAERLPLVANWGMWG